MIHRQNDTKKHSNKKREEENEMRKKTTHTQSKTTASTMKKKKNERSAHFSKIIGQNPLNMYNRTTTVTQYLIHIFDVCVRAPVCVCVCERDLKWKQNPS